MAQIERLTYAIDTLAIEYWRIDFRIRCVPEELLASGYTAEYDRLKQEECRQAILMLGGNDPRTAK